MPLHDELTLTLESNDFPCDRLRVRSLHGTERIGRVFDLRVEVAWLEHDGPSAELMAGARVTVLVELAPGAAAGWHGTRRIHGIVAAVGDLLSTHRTHRLYELRVVPRAFLLGLVETQQIFMNLTVPQIIEQKLTSIGLAGAFEMRLHGAYAAREFVVQYQESDLAFVSRLAEHLGVSFVFEHDEQGDRIVFTDDNAGFRAVEGAERLVFRPRGELLGVFALRADRRIIPAFYAVRDYNYRIPLVDLTSLYELPSGFAGGVVDQGSHYKTPAEGEALVRVRAEERQATQLVYTGESVIPALSAGMSFTLEDHPDLPALDLVVTAVEYRASQVVAGIGHLGEAGYSCTFQAIPRDRAYRPPQETPRPRIYGIVHGIVDAGANGTTTLAQIDEQGRYLVRFLFDTAPPPGAAPSRPVRMAQNHVGENYGTHLPLKPGTEVLISFIDGDPDRPIIVGAVYNPAKPSPVGRATAITHRIRTQTGITVDMVEKT
jgi:type VI secretion system secreted protein VgrG